MLIVLVFKKPQSQRARKTTSLGLSYLWPYFVISVLKIVYNSFPKEIKKKKRNININKTNSSERTSHYYIALSIKQSL